jgi:hypothetical protein
MIDALPTLDADAVKAGLLMESAQTQQRMAETQLDYLRAHTAGLDAVVRDEIRRTLIDEFQALERESRRLVSSLQRLKRSVAVRLTGIVAALALSGALLPGLIQQWTAPGNAELAQLRERRDALLTNIKQLERDGGAIEWRRCGESKRLCVRIDGKAPVYGSAADFYVVKGY